MGEVSFLVQTGVRALNNPSPLLLPLSKEALAPGSTPTTHRQGCLDCECRRVPLASRKQTAHTAWLKETQSPS